jgi:outer membrane protein assembly factor BamB
LYYHGRMRTVAKAAGIAVLGAALLTIYLMQFQGLRIERDGSGIWPMFSFYQPEKHMAAIESNVIAQDAKPVQAPVEVATLAEAAPAAREASEAPKAERAAKPYWTNFRGPRRDGHYTEMAISTPWPATGPPRLWRKPVGGGYASFVIASGKAFTIEQRRNQEVVAAYDMKTGGEMWSHGWDGNFQESMGGDGPRATPTWDDGLLYALGAEGELRCLDAATGRRIWSKNILRENGASNLTWGMSAAPLVVGEKLIVLPGGPNGKSVVAYNKKTGEPVWHSLSDKTAYTSPMLVTLAGKEQLLVVTGQRAVGLTVEDGTLLWEYPWTTSYDINAAQPVMVGPDKLILSAGYGHGAALLQVVQNGGSFKVNRIWENNRMKNKFTSSVLHEGHIYGLDEAILACVNAGTGELAWKGGRYGYGQVALADGHLIVIAEDGDLALVRATPERHDEVVRFSAIKGKTWNHPAIANGVLLVRNTTEMSAFQLR